MLGFGSPFRLRSLSLAAVCIVALSSGSANAQTSTQTDIGHLGGGSAAVNAVAGGFVAGDSTTSSGDRHAFVWSAATGMRDLGALVGGPYSKATGLNSHGEVAGGYYAPDYSSVTAFYWSAATGIRTICAVGNISESPLVINENGVVGGVDAQGRVFRWTLAGGLQDLGATGYGDTYVTAINARGDIAGNSGRGNGGYQVAFIAYGSASTLTLLSSPGLTAPPPPWGGINTGDVNIQINGINDSGVVVGAFWDFGYIYDGYDIAQGGFFSASVHNSHAFKWTSAGGFTDLGNVGVSFLTSQSPATFGASANAINDSETIVGSSFLPTGGYAPFVYATGTGLTQLPALYSGDNAASATGINDDGVVVGYANGLAASVMWNNGVLTNITPSFAPQWPYWPLIKGSTIGGTAYGLDWSQHAWTMAIAITPPAPTQTLTILGGAGNVGDTAPNVEYYNPATGNWQPAYLANYAPYGHPVTHPWGNVTGTNHWINYKTDGASDPGAGPTIANTLWYLYRVRFTVPADAQHATMTFSLKADNLAQVAINGVSTGPTIVGTADQLNADAVFSHNVHPGENTITINVGDYGGLNGFNFRIDLSVESNQPLELVPSGPPPDTTPPVIATPANITVEAAGPSGAVVTFSATATDDVDGSVPVTADPPSGSPFPLGLTTVNLTASDAAGNVAPASFTITVEDTTPPVLSLPPAITAEATGPGGAAVSYAASALDLVSGDVAVTCSTAIGSIVPIGTTVVKCSASDAAGNVAHGSFSITVQDTTAPSLSIVLASRTTLWPPNHQMVTIGLAVNATDTVGVTGYQVTATSNEPDNGLGDGDTANDIQISGSGTLTPTVALRAERSGKGSGRLYTITVVAVDAAGNASAPKTVTVSVPKSQGGK